MSRAPSRARWRRSTASRSSAIRTCPGRIAASASALYAAQPHAFVETLIDKADKALAVNWDDELVKATVLTRDGAVVHPAFAAEGSIRRWQPIDCRTRRSRRRVPRLARPRRRRCRHAEEAAVAARKRYRRPGWRETLGARRPGRDRRGDRSLRLPPGDLRPGDLRRLLRGVVGDAGAAHAADGGHQRDLLGDRRRRAAGGRRSPRRRRGRRLDWRRASASSP